MKFLRALFSIFRRPAPASDYEAEAMFAGWVDLPPQLRVQKAELTPEPSPAVASAAQVFVLPPAAGLQ